MKWQNEKTKSYDSHQNKRTITGITNRNIWLLALVIVAIGLGPMVSSAAFAAGGITVTPADDPHGPLQVYAWGAGIGVAALMAGVGIATTVRKR